MKTFYYKKIREANDFKPRLSEFEMNMEIIKKFPLWVRESLATVNRHDIKAVSEALSQLETVRLERERISERKQQSWNNNKFTNQTATVNQIQACVRGRGNSRNFNRHYNRSGTYTP